MYIQITLKKTDLLPLMKNASFDEIDTFSFKISSYHIQRADVIYFVDNKRIKILKARPTIIRNN